MDRVSPSRSNSLAKTTAAGLQVERHLAYFVKQQGTAVRQLEFASLGGVGAGEGPLGVTE